MRYALLLYAAPGSADEADEADEADGSEQRGSWADYTRALREAGVLLGAEQLRDTPRAVAVGMADGPLAGLAALAPVLAAGVLDGYGPLRAAHADLLERAGQAHAARAAWGRAVAATDNPALREELRRRMESSG